MVAHRRYRDDRHRIYNGGRYQADGVRIIYHRVETNYGCDTSVKRSGMEPGI